MLWQTEVDNAASHWGRYYGVNVDPALVHAVLERESGHGRAPAYVANHGIVPEPGGHFSYGPMQVYDDTARTWLKLTFPPEDLASHPALGIWYGTKYLAYQLKRYGGNVERAIAAYNAGSALTTASGAFVNQSYVDAVKRFWSQYRGVVASVVPALTLAALIWWLMSRTRRGAALGAAR